MGFPFSAIVAQDETKLSLLVAAVDPSIGGVLLFGDRGTGKSTAVRALAQLLPPMRAVKNCRYACDPSERGSLCDECRKRKRKGTLRSHAVPVPVVDLPLGSTEDRVIGTLDLERALTSGKKAFESGLLARANRGFLYVDEVNLLEDHLVDLLLDVCASGQNIVEREGLSVRHPARFVLIGSGNPEEGELRPQLLDRFGLSVQISTPTELADRVEVVRRREEFERSPAAFAARWHVAEQHLRARITEAHSRLNDIPLSDQTLSAAAALCMHLGTDGLRGELTLVRAARALAALEGSGEVDNTHLRRMALPALSHRLRRNPLDETGSATRVQRAVNELFADP